ncbi:HAD family hydrolase [Paenibacillus sp. MBLB4367]|uniref:HAD family hydrolase n=1 Tax=Paenibacillus sp. MBLB4367 TaxID=3384767 RepID=UPI003908081F
MTIKAVLFDFDGTLADTLPLCFESFRKLFREYDGRHVSDEEVVSMFGPSEAGIIRIHLAKKEGVDQAIEDFYASYEELHTEMVKPHREIAELLQQLKASGIKLGIVTGKARRSLDISLRLLELTDLFDVSITGDDVTEPKPAPEGVLKALSMLGAGQDEAVFVGDSDADIAAGRSAGVTVIGVRWLDVVQSPVFAFEPDATVSNAEEFRRYLAAFPQA